MNRRIAFSCIVLILIVCLGLSVVVIFGAGFLVWKSETIVDSSPSQNTPTSQANPIDPPQPGESTAINPGILAEMELIQRQVIQERGLEETGVFTRVLFTKDQLRQRVLDDFLEDYSPEEAQNDVLVLDSFGLLNPDFDMLHFYQDLLSEQVAGFYDNETKEMVVVQGSQFGGPERLTYAHEFTHALQDQNYDVRNGLNFSEEKCENDTERCVAIQSLIEGDASLSELNWFVNHATTEDKTDIFDFYDTFKSPVLDTAPEFFAKDFLFPYENGLTFTQYLYEHGGWDAVDQAYANLPASSEQILHPERYPEDIPILVNLPELSAALGEGWEELDRGVMGEWYMYLILAYGLDADAQVKEKDAAEAAEGWGGDSYAVFYRPEDGATLMILRTNWESSKDLNEYVNVFEDYARDRFGRPENQERDRILWQDGSEVHVLHIEGIYTTWILAPDEGLANQVWESIQNQKSP